MMCGRSKRSSWENGTLRYVTTRSADKFESPRVNDEVSPMHRTVLFIFLSLNPSIIYHFLNLRTLKKSKRLLHIMPLFGSNAKYSINCNDIRKNIHKCFFLLHEHVLSSIFEMNFTCFMYEFINSSLRLQLTGHITVC